MILEKIDQDLLALAKQSDNDLKYIMSIYFVFHI